MCVVCGCGGPVGAEELDALDRSADPAVSRDEWGAWRLDFGAGAACASVPGMSAERTLRIEQDVLGANNRIADRNRRHFISHRVLALNLVSSPGAGKTTLLCATIAALRERTRLTVGVIEGDQQTSFDAERIRATGAPAVQINTGKGCHLDASMVAQAFTRLPLHDHHHDHHHDHDHGHHHHNNEGPTGQAAAHDERSHLHPHEHEHPHAHEHAHAEQAAEETRGVLFIENVGNLVCPALWDLGEAAKVVVLSVTEGEDKPLKYPDMFAAARVMVLNKIDLLPHVRFDVARCIEYARRVNPHIDVIRLSAATGEGFDAWLDWLLAARPERAGAAACGPEPAAAAEAASHAGDAR